MTGRMNRRGFAVSSVIGAAAVGAHHLNGLPLLSGMVRVSDEQVQADSDFVRFRPEIEPLVRLIEDTARPELLEVIGRRVRDGLSYQHLLAALFLAGIRNVQPRPAVGFKFHAVLVVNSAHLASMASPEQDRWLPIFWALDEFKSSQARDVNEGNWTMPAVNESTVPAPENVTSAFDSAMQRWDEGAADTAAAGVARYLGANSMLELFAKYAARDFRSIGHKAIYLANSWRTLQTIGWQHSEPVIRSLAYALLNHHGEPNPADTDLAPDRSWKFNETIVDSIRPGWLQGRADSAATTELLTILRTSAPSEVAETVVRLLNGGIAPQSILDGLHSGAAELLMRQSGIVSLHAVTSVNALRFLFDNVADERTRKMLLLQSAAFLPQFRESMASRGAIVDAQIDAYTDAADDHTLNPQQRLETILSSIRKDSAAAAFQTAQWLNSGNDPQNLMHETRRLIFLKGNDSHDYKFSSAVLEDYYKISPAWRNNFLAASTYSLRGSSEKDVGLIARIRSVLSF